MTYRTRLSWLLILLAVLATVSTAHAADETKVVGFWNYDVVDNAGKTLNVVDANLKGFEAQGWTVVQSWSQTFIGSFWDGTKDVVIPDKNGWVFVWVRLKKATPAAPSPSPQSQAPSGPAPLPTCGTNGTTAWGNAPASGWVHIPGSSNGGAGGWVMAGMAAASAGDCLAP